MLHCINTLNTRMLKLKAMLAILLLLLLSTEYISAVSSSKVLSDFCLNSLPQTENTFRTLPTEIGYLKSCCAQQPPFPTQNECFQTTLAIIPFVMFNLQHLLARIETSRVAPTIVKANNIDPYMLARKLHRAIDGWGTDENSIINVLSSITGKQRIRTSIKYKELFNSYLKSDLRGDTSGSFKHLLIALMYFPAEHDAWLVRDAIAPSGTKHDVLVDVVATSTVNEMLHVREAYQRFYNASLEKDLAKELKGQGVYRDTILHMATRYSNHVNTTWAQQIVRRSNQASKDHISNLVRVIRAIYTSSVGGRHSYFAQRLHTTMAGVGTKDSELIGLVTSRVERDMKAVEESYLELYGHSLASDLKGDLSGDTLKLMLKLI
ncbi:annexin A8-like [Symsagittifera roscoffensis]|uniref:annexin A8-like n=1 Tax=Symsagittifera roscoffensis TaxID=84072 RepID=UPI00307B1D09